jgi:hypothetical protein
MTYAIKSPNTGGPGLHRSPNTEKSGWGVGLERAWWASCRRPSTFEGQAVHFGLLDAFQDAADPLAIHRIPPGCFILGMPATPGGTACAPRRPRVCPACAPHGPENHPRRCSGNLQKTCPKCGFHQPKKVFHAKQKLDVYWNKWGHAGRMRGCPTWPASHIIITSPTPEGVMKPTPHFVAARGVGGVPGLGTGTATATPEPKNTKIPKRAKKCPTRHLTVPKNSLKPPKLP